MTTADLNSCCPETVMIDRCAGCACRPGTEANRSEWTQMLFSLCVESGEAFICHEHGAQHICKGFADAFTVKLRNGDYDRLPEWKRKVFRQLTEVMEDYRIAINMGKEFDIPDAVRKATKKALDGVTP